MINENRSRYYRDDRISREGAFKKIISGYFQIFKGKAECTEKRKGGYGKAKEVSRDGSIHYLKLNSHYPVNKLNKLNIEEQEVNELGDNSSEPM
jgi:hypothetical protein